MAERYIKRTLEPVLAKAARQFPAVVLTGPRQSGKTTLLRRLFGPTHRYASLEPPDLRETATRDPRGFLAAYPPPVIFDEMQYAPELLSYIKEEVDAHRSRPGQFILTGSQNLLLLAGVSETLAGRTAVLHLLPLSRAEAEGRPQTPPVWERGARIARAKRISRRALWLSFLRGGYPELIAHPGRDLALWHSAYVATYLERDVRSLRAIGDLTQFQSFLRLLAARSGQLFNMTDLARDLGTAVNTVKAWLSVLEATNQIVILRPYFANVGKRLVKTPKVYFTDVGTLCHIAGLRDPEHAASGPMGGAIFETAVLSEIRKGFLHRGVDPQVYFWRTSAGLEVDFLIDLGGRLVPIEVKSTASPRVAMAGGIRTLRELLGERVEPGFLVHTGDVRLPLGDAVTAVPWVDF